MISKGLHRASSVDRFLFDGKRINDDETPKLLEMEDNDTIDVFKNKYASLNELFERILSFARLYRSVEAIEARTMSHVARDMFLALLFSFAACVCTYQSGSGSSDC